MNVKRLNILIIRLSILMVLYTLLRVAFVVRFTEQYRAFPSEQIFRCFVEGLRFDISALTWVSSPFLIALFLPSRFRFERALFILVHGSFLIAAASDVELYTFTGKRLTLEFFQSLGLDIIRQASQITIYYWYVPFTIILLCALVWWAEEKVSSLLTEKRLSFRGSVIVFLVIGALSFIAIRGGLQHKSIHIQTAFTQGANELGQLTLNSPYHFLRTFNAPKLQKKNWFTDDELKTALLERRGAASAKGIPRQNVVLVILESVSLEYFEEGFTPFLKELADKGAFFERHFANGRRSIEVLSSLLDGVPSVQEIPFSKSPSQSMPLIGLATKLREQGYENVFFHGAPRGSMGFDSYTLSHGFKRYVSRGDFPEKPGDFDGQWGIFDGPFLQFTVSELSKLPAPFFTGVFTLTSHQPYTIPEEYRGRFPKGHLEIHESIGYVDEMLRQFFQSARDTAWFENTYFIITADHTQKLSQKKFLNSLGAYRVPLIIYHPRQKLFAPVKVTQHIDLPATVMDLLELPEYGLNALGESAFAPTAGRALHFLRPDWQYVSGERVTKWIEDSVTHEFLWDAATGEIRSDAGADLKRESQYYIQYVLNGLKAHKWPFVLGE